MKREYREIRVKKHTFIVTNTSEKRVPCGHLFLADKCTDECSIAMEPINKAVLEAAPGLIVNPL